ncbi:LOW QUALITY PROTEIN: acyl-CoA Delta-9 desaturase [Pieris rapae]|uniref:LOW QUALITY PROTEIN: acyl-CoA Delta-9 desaturase n=1 Tax=Pieris rapae TaxID=64459 RepID=UPI001E27E7C2|nr:LOW QUALITY PROTEIN: acyl-CoA Delta-9 desaturase [Pieris rapae]
MYELAQPNRMPPAQNVGLRSRHVTLLEGCDIKSDSKVNSLTESDISDKSDDFDISFYESIEFKPQIRWPDLLVQISLHSVAIYGLCLILMNQVKFYTLLFVLATIYTSGFGITAGVHRLWSHRAYKAKLPLRCLLALLFTITGQRDIYTWALDHRVHHKYTETVADPHDVRRGFWFAHVGWLVLTPHPAVENRRIALNKTSQDLIDDPVVRFQKLFFIPLFLILNIILPLGIPIYYWDEDWMTSFSVSFVLRFTITLNIAYCVNSFAHIWGNKPYDKYIKSVENQLVSLAALGEGWHNYHHVFPWDYRTSELGKINISTSFIDFFARIGWAYDLKAATMSMIETELSEAVMAHFTTKKNLIHKHNFHSYEIKVYFILNILYYLYK